MEPDIQLVSTDFDGTIFAEFEQPPVPHAFQEAIRTLQARGAKWVINTGRDLSSLMEAMGRAHLAVRPDYLVLVERELYRHDGVRYVGIEDWNRRCTADHTALFERVADDVPRLEAWINARYDADVYADAYSPFCLIARENGDADEICAWLDDYCRTVPHLTVVRNDVYARFSHTAYSKGTALAELTGRLRLQTDQVFAAGDHFNDLPMLDRRVARWLACPANAMPAVKAQVTAQGGLVSDLPHGHAVAAALRQWIESNQPSPSDLA
jgi:hydroxymethylpyrimidine pyrophosphatase-like HAD family hydrolase